MTAPSFPEPSFIDTNGIRMAVYEQGSGSPVVLLHGFPELAFSWRYQMPALAAAGYHAIAPDQRGYGRSDVPGDVRDYRVEELIADLHGLLDALELDSATFVGHDWGALLLWQMAMRAPARMDRLIALNIPHYPRLPVDPIHVMRERFGDNFYIVNFQDSDEADKAFASDPAHFFNVMMRRGQISREQFDALPADRKTLSLLKIMARDESSGEPLLTDAERDYYAAAFARTGFTGPINWYRNWTLNWETQADFDQRIDIPTLFIGAVDDVVVPLERIEAMRPLVADLEIHMLEHCGHWSQQEQPDEVNRLIIDWLQRRSA
jgi:pimeloyl-ACP methyl ester carboxylesterase